MSSEHFKQINTIEVDGSLQIVGLTDIGRVFVTSLPLDNMGVKEDSEQPYCIPDWVQILAPDFDLDD